MSPHPWGENIRCHPSEAWPANRTASEPPAFRGIGDVEPATVEYPPLAWNPALETYDSLTSIGTNGELEAAISAELFRLFALFKERQRKYGPGNIAAFGDYGVLVRCHDKLARLKRHYTEGTGDMPDESVEDAWRDLAVYAVIALVCREGGWPGWAKGGAK